MKIIVTGSNGLLGRYVANAFIENGDEVIGIDANGPREGHSWNHVTADLRDLGSVLQIVRNVDGVAHLAGIPRPIGRVPSAVFQTNTAINFNIFEAVVIHNIGRLVYASSMSVLGYPFFEQDIRPSYLPLDSRHPVAAQDAYGLSKWIGEEILEATVRRRPLMRAVSLRMPWIQAPETFPGNAGPRRDRALENPRDLWGYIDVRDAAAAFVASMGAAVAGHARVFISAADTFMEEETMGLVEAAYPGVKIIRPINGCETVFDLSEAAAQIGFKPQYSWRDYPPTTPSHS